MQSIVNLTWSSETVLPLTVFSESSCEHKPILQINCLSSFGSLMCNSLFLHISISWINSPDFSVFACEQYLRPELQRRSSKIFEEHSISSMKQPSPKYLISYTTLCKLGCFLPWKNHEFNIKQFFPKIFKESSLQLWPLTHPSSSKHWGQARAIESWWGTLQFQHSRYKHCCHCQPKEVCFELKDATKQYQLFSGGKPDRQHIRSWSLWYHHRVFARL